MIRALSIFAVTYALMNARRSTFFVSVLASNVVSNVPWVVIAARWLPHGPGHERE